MTGRGPPWGGERRPPGWPPAADSIGLSQGLFALKFNRVYENAPTFSGAHEDEGCFMSLFGVFRADLEEALVRWAARAPPRPATYPPRSPQPLPPATAQNLCTGPPTNARRSSGTSMPPSWTGSMPSGQWAVDFSTPPLRRCPLDIFRGGGCRVGIGGAGEGGKGSTPHAQQRPPPAAHKIRHHVGCQCDRAGQRL